MKNQKQGHRNRQHEISVYKKSLFIIPSKIECHKFFSEYKTSLFAFAKLVAANPINYLVGNALSELCLQFLFHSPLAYNTLTAVFTGL